MGRHYEATGVLVQIGSTSEYTLHYISDNEALLYNANDGSVAILNETAAFIWETFLRIRSVEGTIDALVRRWPKAKELEDLQAVLADTLNAGPVGLSSSIISPYSCSNPQHDVLELTFDDHLVLVLDLKQKCLSVVEQRPERVRVHLEAIAPKMFALLGYHVFHAAWVEKGGRSWLLTGNSGAGKSTLARAMVAAGAKILADDKVLIDSSIANQPRGFSGGEFAMRSWIDQSIDTIVRGAGKTQHPLLPVTVPQDKVSLNVLALLDVEQRREGTVEVVEKELTEIEATIASIQQTFFSLDTFERSSELIASCTRLHRGVRSVRLFVPNGLGALNDAADNYMQKVTS